MRYSTPCGDCLGFIYYLCMVVDAVDGNNEDHILSSKDFRKLLHTKNVWLLVHVIFSCHLVATGDVT